MNVFGTTELSYNIEKLINEDTSFLIIVTPYLKLTDRLRAKLEISFKKISEVYFLYRKNELKRDDYLWLSQKSNVRLIPIQNLHAKIYMNRTRCIITSMNLYEYSQINNHEIGIELNAEDSQEEFNKVVKEIELMLLSSGSKIDFTSVLNEFEDFSIGNLFHNLMNKFDLYGGGRNNEFYINFSNWLRSIIDFNQEDLYQDKSAVLRSTCLGREKYGEIYNIATKENIRINNSVYN